MTERSDTVEVLRAAWSASSSDHADLDQTCGHKKTCRNARDFSFDGFANRAPTCARRGGSC